MPKYTAWTSASPTSNSAVRATIQTGTAVRTLMQIATPSTCPIKILRWWLSGGHSAAAAPGIFELIETDVGAGVLTSFTPEKYGDPGQASSLCVGGASATGFWNASTTEGTITATRTADAHQIAPTTQFSYEWVLDNEFIVARSKFLRIRCDAGVDTAVIGGVLYEEW